MTDQARARAAFRALHERGCFLIPNPWDAGSARWLAHLGFKALATTSSGFAFSRGMPDSDPPLTRETMLAHVAELAAATDLPVNADFKSGYARDPEGVAESVRLCVETGVAGLSIEDSTGDPERPLFDRAEAVERVAAARAAIDRSGADVLLTARAECHLVGHPDPLDESLARLRAYAAAGADVLYAPGPRSREDIRAIVEAVAPKPVNVLMIGHTGLTLADLEELGVRRVSVGSGLQRVAFTAFALAARAMADRGTFEGLDGLLSARELDAFFGSRERARRSAY